MPPKQKVASKNTGGFGQQATGRGGRGKGGKGKGAKSKGAKGKGGKKGAAGGDSGDGKKRKLGCGRCGVEGHYAKECTFTGCYACKKEGHKSADCPSRPIVTCWTCEKQATPPVTARRRSRRWRLRASYSIFFGLWLGISSCVSDRGTVQ